MSGLKAFEYSGEYEIIPDVEDEQTLETAHKLLTDNIVVAKVPYFETSNDSNGNTASLLPD